MCCASPNASGSTFHQSVHTMNQSSGSVDHVVHDHTIAACYITDHVQNFRFIGLLTTFINDGNGAIQLSGHHAGTHHTTYIGRNDGQTFNFVLIDVIDHQRQGINVVYRDFKEPLNGSRMEIHRQNPVELGFLDQAGHHTGRDWHSGLVLAILAGVSEVRKDRRHRLRRGPL